jgi:hypothetical protein
MRKARFPEPFRVPCLATPGPALTRRISPRVANERIIAWLYLS